MFILTFNINLFLNRYSFVGIISKKYIIGIHLFLAKLQLKYYILYYFNIGSIINYLFSLYYFIHFICSIYEITSCGPENVQDKVLYFFYKYI